MKLPPGAKTCDPCGVVWYADPVCPGCGKPPAARKLRGKGTTNQHEMKLVRDCLDLLGRCGVWAWRANSGAVVIPETATSARRFVKFHGAPGCSDIIGMWSDEGGRFLAIECKVGKNKPTAAQQAFLDRVQANGGMAVVVWSIEDLKSWLRDHGVKGALVWDGSI